MHFLLFLCRRRRRQRRFCHHHRLHCHNLVLERKKRTILGGNAPKMSQNN